MKKEKEILKFPRPGLVVVAIECGCDCFSARGCKKWLKRFLLVFFTSVTKGFKTVMIMKYL